jgi:formate dehydrogenase subunit delta
MSADHLVQMANQIGQFYEALPHREEGLDGVAGHLRKFWDPRMRRQLLSEIDEGGAPDLSPFVREAIERHRAELTPPARIST